jgi:hypothetical protein
VTHNLFLFHPQTKDVFYILKGLLKEEEERKEEEEGQKRRKRRSRKRKLHNSKN